jgi:beta-carotene ketolase (CrtW type)
VQKLQNWQPLKRNHAWTGLAFAIVCLMGWFLSLILFINSDLSGLNSAQIVAAIGLRTFLQTGLFILAHDAMHQSLWPNHLGWNHRLGSIALWCYGGVNYEQCRRNHYQHHHHPGSDRDPDLMGKNARIFSWYFNFLRNYLSSKLLLKIILNLAILLLIALLNHSSLGQAFWNLSLFYLLPLILSSWQLFIFGTYLPHRLIPGEPSLPHHSRSLNHPQWLSFLLCFHFGYHWEHHEYPYLPWYKLPTAHRWSLQPKSSPLIPSRELKSVL